MTINYCTKDPQKIDYDERYDILYVVFGDNRHSYEDEYDTGFGLIRDMDTDEVVGVSCYGYKEKKRKEKMIDLLRELGVSTLALQ